MTAAELTETEAEVRERLRWDTPTLAEHCFVIVTKGGQRQRLFLKDEQLRFHDLLETQREQGLPERIISLKARQVGISTVTQAKIIQRVTQYWDHRALVLAHDNRTPGSCSTWVASCGTRFRMRRT
jgi:hypothetical protein